MFNGLVSAIRTLSILPVPGRDAEKMSRSLPWFPLVGGLLGGILFGLGYSLSLIPSVWPGFSAGILLSASVILTRGLHLDGLADWADGFFGARDPKRVLSIMKDSSVGTFGILALILVMLLKWVALSRLINLGGMVFLLSAYVVSRTVQVALAVCLPYARSEGGTASPFVEGAKSVHLVWAFILSLLLVMGFNGVAGGILLLAGLILCALLGWWFFRRLNGVTGDLLGAASEMIETSLLLFAALFTQFLSQC